VVTGPNLGGSGPVAPRGPAGPQGKKDEVPPCRMEVSDGSWSGRFGGYIGPGFEVNFGEDMGNFFVTLRVGFGLGGGVSWSPTGNIPGPAPNSRDTGGVVLSASGRASFSYGPLGTSLEGGAARNYSNEASAFYGSAGGSARGMHSRGASAGGSLAAQATFYSPRTTSYARQGRCRASY
jgi:hypothetical protein